MTCSELHPEIALLAGDELPADRRPAVERHLEECAACRRLADSLREDRRTLRQLADEPIDPEALRRIRTGVREAIAAEHAAHAKHANRQPVHRALLALAAVLGLLALGLAPWLAGLRFRLEDEPPRQATVGESERQAAPGEHPPTAAGSSRETPDLPAPADRAAQPGTGAGEGAEVIGPIDGRARAIEPAPGRLAHAAPVPETTPSPSGPTTNDHTALLPEGPGASAPVNSVNSVNSVYSPSITIRIVSDDPDIVFYWLVDEPKEVSDDAAV